MISINEKAKYKMFLSKLSGIKVKQIGLAVVVLLFTPLKNEKGKQLVRLITK